MCLLTKVKVGELVIQRLENWSYYFLWDSKLSFSSKIYRIKGNFCLRQNE